MLRLIKENLGNLGDGGNLGNGGGFERRFSVLLDNCGAPILAEGTNKSLRHFKWFMGKTWSVPFILSFQRSGQHLIQEIPFIFCPYA